MQPAVLDSEPRQLFLAIRQSSSSGLSLISCVSSPPTIQPVYHLYPQFLFPRCCFKMRNMLDRAISLPMRRLGQLFPAYINRSRSLLLSSSSSSSSSTAATTTTSSYTGRFFSSAALTSPSSSSSIGTKLAHQCLHNHPSSSRIASKTFVQSAVQSRGMKTRSSVKRLCDGCKVCQ